MRALVVVLWRAGLRIGEALALVASDLDPTRGSILVRHGKGDKRRESGMDDWAWDQVGSWMAARQAFPVGPLFYVITGPTAGRPWRERVCRSTSSSATRTSESRRSTAELMRSEAAAHARLAAEPAEVSAHGALLQGIDSGEIVAAVHGRPAPVMPASAGLRLA